MSDIYKVVSAAFCPIIFLVAHAMAGPPFLTDDPEPVEYQHWEAYLFTMGMSSGSGYSIEGPATEFNYGVCPDTQLHLIVPMTSVDGSGMPAASGLGDIEIGVKYRFVHENDTRPQIGSFPMAELPGGDAGRGLGNGRTWFRLPIWLQKSWGPWTTYGGVGAALNSAPGQRNYPFSIEFRRLLQRHRAFLDSLQWRAHCCRRPPYPLVFRLLRDLVKENEMN
jgi:hypothetical protein